jgi:hypothetical protein
MNIKLSINELPKPVLEFGGAGTGSDPKAGLMSAGPFDLRFGSARSETIAAGMIGPSESLDDVQAWIERCESGIAALRANSQLRRSFDGFSKIFRKRIVVASDMTVQLGSENKDVLGEALLSDDPFIRFRKTLVLYSEALQRLAARESNRPDIVFICLPPSVRDLVGNVERDLTPEAKKIAKDLAKRRASSQLNLLDMLDEVEEAPEDLLKRDFRHALKACALACKLPIQIVTRKTTHETNDNEDPATRAWNFSVGAYYKSGGVPWRVRPEGPQSCFVGVSFHHHQTAQKHVVQSSLAHAFSSDGEGFAIRGGGVPVEPGQRLNVHLSEDQAHTLGKRIQAEYRLRTGTDPLRIVIHKTSKFDEAEESGFRAALIDTPILSLVSLVPSELRLFRFGAFPPQVGTIFSVNSERKFLYTTGYVPEFATYPGSHIPQPLEIHAISDEPKEVAARDIFNLTRMNWNTADLKGKFPVTLSFSRKVGGILSEYGDDDPDETSFRYFV